MEIVVNIKQCPECTFQSECDIILNYHIKEVHDFDMISDINDEEAIQKCCCDDCKLETELKFDILKRLGTDNNEQYEICMAEAPHNIDVVEEEEAEQPAADDEDDCVLYNEELIEEGVEYPTVYIEEYDESISTRSSPLSEEVQLYNDQYNN